MRDTRCPICSFPADHILSIPLGVKMRLPTDINIRHCPGDNFAFVAAGLQQDYNEYYASLANDSVHQELAAGTARSPISILQCECLVTALGNFFSSPRKVLDFGCGEASLLIELATRFPASTFIGFDPGPAALTARKKTSDLGIDNLSFINLEECEAQAPFDLIILSHVLEHVLSLDFLSTLRNLLDTRGMIYIEVPDALQYDVHQRQEFLYYFDRLHVNHFTPQALARLASNHCLSYVKHFSYSFPYRDQRPYPALGMIFDCHGKGVPPLSPSILEVVSRYVRDEKLRSRHTAGLLNTFANTLVWGTGDNFYRSMSNDGPLAGLKGKTLLDQSRGDVIIEGSTYPTMDPLQAIQMYPWPVIITISEDRKKLDGRIREIDATRQVYFI